MFELVAALLAAMATLTAPSSAHPATTASTSSGRTNLTAIQADAAVAATGTAPADATAWRWSCSLPMAIHPSAGTGVTDAQLRAQLVYPVEYLRDLGYNVTVGASVPYVREMALADQPGEVVVTATTNAAEQPVLAGDAARSWMNKSGRDALAATVVVKANPAVGELAGDILLHEFGHVVGLNHKHGTVMDTSWDAPATLDAAEVAAVDCR